MMTRGMRRTSPTLMVGASGLLALAALLRASGAAAAELPAAAAQGSRLEVLNSNSFVRFCVGLKTPEYAAADGSRKIPTVGRDQKPLDTFEIPLPAGWQQPGFDDSNWFRARLPWEPPRIGNDQAGFDANKRYLTATRATFVVADPSTVRDLRLSVSHIGGVVVYLNGVEIGRKNLPAGPIAADTFAEPYAKDPYTDDSGQYYAWTRDARTGQWEPSLAERYASRWRPCELTIPAGKLIAGLNVLAIENHRSPIHEAQITATRRPPPTGGYTPGRFGYLGLRDVVLTAEAGAAVSPNTSRPQGFQVWGCAPEAIVSAAETPAVAPERMAINQWYGDPGSPARIAIVAVRNGVFSGRLVVSSTETIKGLLVKAGDLAQAQGPGRIAGKAVRVRYAARATPASSWVGPNRFDALLDAPPAEVDIEPKARTAVVPVWLTVKVPADAAPGVYAGPVTVAAEGQQSVTVPFRVTVHGWRMPDPKDFRVHNLGSTSAETLALYYKLPLWSDRHFALIGQSLKLMAEVGSRMVFENLVVEYGTHGNSESMVRWVKQANGKYTHDFTVFDRYLDAVAANVGKPLPLVLNMWEDVMIGKDGVKRTRSMGGTHVTTVDPTTGQLDRLQVPFPDEPEMVAFWKPVLDEIKKRLDKRGWYDVAAAGDLRYTGSPLPQVTSNFKQMWPDGKWYSQQHGLFRTFPTAEKGTTMPLIACTTVWGEGFMKVGALKDLWKKPEYIPTGFARNRHGDASPFALLMGFPEEMLWRSKLGIGPLGGDYWPLKNEKGQWYNMGGTSALGPQCSTRAILAPGPDGPVASERYEMFRKGVQIGEAMLYLQMALDENKIGGDLATKVGKLLEDRLHMFESLRSEWGRGFDVWVYMSQVEPQADRLFAACSEVAKAAGQD